MDFFNILMRVGAHIGTPVRRGSQTSQHSCYIEIEPRDWGNTFILLHELTHAIRRGSATHRYYRDSFFTPSTRHCLRLEEAIADETAELVSGIPLASLNEPRYPPVTGIRGRTYVDWHVAHAANTLFTLIKEVS